MNALNNAVQQSDVKTWPGDGLSTVLGVSSHLSARGKSNVMKPSAKAMFLNNVFSPPFFILLSSECDLDDDSLRPEINSRKKTIGKDIDIEYD